MRLGLATKIFGVTLLLVILMTAAAAVALFLVRQVTADLVLIERNYLPITRTVAQIQAAALEQEIQVGRAFASIRAQRDAPVDAHIEAIVAFGERVDADVASALTVLRAAQAAARNADHRVALARLDVKTEQLEREHQDLQDTALQAVSALREGKEALAAALVDLMEKEEQQFNDALRNLADAAASFASSATASAIAAERQILFVNVLLTALAAAIGLALSFLIVRGITRPVQALVKATGQIERGDLTAEIPVLTKDEIGELARSFNHMAGELRVKEKIKETFGRYVDPRIVENLLGGGGVPHVGGESVDCTVYFSDIRGFTGIAERLTPSAIVNLVNGYFTAMSVPVRESKGIIDKYIGDAIMAFWAPPFTAAREHASLACGAALAQLARLDQFQGEIPNLTGLRRDFPDVRMRIGIATGEVVVGSIGSDVSRNYTVMGDTVNLGSRLEGLNKVYGTTVLVSAETERSAREAFVFREVDWVRVVGRHEPERIFELVGATDTVDPQRLRIRDHYEAGLAAYRRRDWDAAADAFARCRELDANDSPSAVFAARVQRLRANPPAPEWDGVWQAEAK